MVIKLLYHGNTIKGRRPWSRTSLIKKKVFFFYLCDKLALYTAEFCDQSLCDRVFDKCDLQYCSMFIK